MSTKTYTAICKDPSDPNSTHWISAVEGNTVAEAARAAIAECAEAWGCDDEGVVLLGLFEGDVAVAAWDDSGYATADMIDSAALQAFAESMPEIISVQQLTLTEWLTKQADWPSRYVAWDELITAMDALTETDVVVDDAHPDWEFPCSEGITPRDHLRDWWRTFWESRT